MVHLLMQQLLFHHRGKLHILGLSIALEVYQIVLVSQQEHIVLGIVKNRGYHIHVANAHQRH